MQLTASEAQGLIVATTALTASVLGPFVTLTVARRQFRATVVSSNRQKWIDTFRDRLAELCCPW